MRSALGGVLLLFFATGCTTPPRVVSRTPVIPPSPSTDGFVSVRSLAQKFAYDMVEEPGGRYLRLLRRDSNLKIDAESRVVYLNDRLILLEDVPRRWGTDVWVPGELARRLSPVSTPKTPSSPKRLGPLVERGGALMGYRVVVDAGHGGRDPGAISRDGLQEKHVVLEVAREVARLLRAGGAIVSMTRSDDHFVSLDQRVADSRRTAPDIFVSIHANAAVNTRARGIEVFRPVHRLKGQRRNKIVVSSKLARSIYNRLEQVSPVSDRGVKPDERGLRVLKYNRDPAVLVELGFLSNRDDLSRLRSAAYRARLARAIATGISDFAARERARGGSSS